MKKKCFYNICKFTTWISSLLSNSESRNCVKSVQIRSFSDPNSGKYGPEKNSVFGHFSDRENLFCFNLLVFSFRWIFLWSLIGWSFSNKLLVSFSSLAVWGIIFPWERRKQWKQLCSGAKRIIIMIIIIIFIIIIIIIIFPVN